MKKFNHFATTEANVNVRRSTFDRSNGIKGTMPTGKLIPLYVDEVLPGDTRKITASSVLRGATPLSPVMDNAFFDLICMFVPNRLVFDKWEEFMGENNEDAWTPPQEYVIPRTRIGFTNQNVMKGILHTPIDYMNAIGGLCLHDQSQNVTSVGGKSTFRSFSSLYARGMCKCWNDWFRNENTQSPAKIDLGHEDDEISYNETSLPLAKEDYVVHAQRGIALLPVNKFKDYFTSCNPQPQKHAPLTVPIGEYAPIENNMKPVEWHDKGYITGEGFFSPILWKNYRNAPFEYGHDSPNQYYLSPFFNTADNVYQGTSSLAMVKNSGADTDNLSQVDQVTLNLVANLKNATSVTINQLRLIMQTQRFYEKQALYGSRYTEMLYSMFGVYSADSRLQRAEFLGGKRIPITQYQVTQTVDSDNSFLGNTGAFSLTNDKSFLCNKSFTEHGILYVFGCVRTFQSYSQGQEKQFARRELFDFYFPVFAHIGEQPVDNKEIYYVGEQSGAPNSLDTEPFGYQEAFAEYRMKQNRICGYLRPEVSNNLSYWHYGNFFKTRPVLGDTFTRETDENVKRTLAVEDDAQWIFDISFNEIATRPMPIYSVPGLVDHF